MALPPVAPDELARRLQITYPSGPLDPQIQAATVTAVSMLTPHVDDTLANQWPAIWSEAVIQTGVKVWDSGAKGLAGMDAGGEFTFPAPSASAGILDATKGLWGLLTLTGGNVIA